MFSVLLAAALFAQAAPTATAADDPFDAPVVMVKPKAAEPAKTVSPVVVTPTPLPGVEAAQSTVICKDEPVLGSLFPKKVCATRRELQQRTQQDQDEVRRIQAYRPEKAN